MYMYIYIYIYIYVYIYICLTGLNDLENPTHDVNKRNDNNNNSNSISDSLIQIFISYSSVT